MDVGLYHIEQYSFTESEALFTVVDEEVFVVSPDGPVPEYRIIHPAFFEINS